MELSSKVFHDVLSPLAAFPSASHTPALPERTPHRDGSPRQEAKPTPTGSSKSGPDATIPDADQSRAPSPDHVPWEISFVNPQARIDAIGPWGEPSDMAGECKGQWRLDGVGADGQRVFAVPEFAMDSPPLRIDVHLPPPEEYEPAWLRNMLAPESLVSLSTRGRESMSRHPALLHLVRALRVWTEMQGRGAFQDKYNMSPFGSRIVVTRVLANVGRMAEGIHLVPDYDVEAAMLSAERLQALWRDVEIWPPVVKWDRLRFQRQLHEAISIVTVEGDMPAEDARHPNELLRPAGADQVQDAATRAADSKLKSQPITQHRRVVFKSLLRDQRYLYNEIRMLMTLDPHPHVLGRPLGVVAKRSRFGGRLGVCGFLMAYFEGGNLHEVLTDFATSREGEGPEGADGAMRAELKLKWAREITSALVHVNSHPSGFYPDLKPDNVMLRGKDAVLLDFEQRGGWYTWSPPEILYVEYLEHILAGLGNEWDEVRNEIATLLTRGIAGWQTSSQQDWYKGSHGGFSMPWRDMLRKRTVEGSLALEKAQVYMVGKLLWCIFEETPFVRSGIDHELLRDLNMGRELGKRPRFPEFQLAPPRIRHLIRACTQGDRAWDEKHGRSGTLFVSGTKLLATGPDGDERGAEVMARAWWVSEVKRAKEFMVEGSTLRERLEEDARRRPTLVQVLRTLDEMDTTVRWDCE